MEKYEKLHWRVYRWFRWDAKHFHRDVIQGFKNLWKWLPIVWKDRDWDYHFIFEVLKFKIKNTAKYTEKKQRFVGWEKEVRYMKICETLIDRIQTEYYQTEYQDYHDFDMSTVPTENGLYEVVFYNVDEELLESLGPDELAEFFGIDAEFVVAVEVN